MLDDVKRILDDVLQLDGRSVGWSADTALLGDIPELDSMAVVSVITALEDQYGFVVDDDEISAATFATVGTLAEFVERKASG